MRVIELVSVSRANARGTSAGGTLSPTMRRRVDISVDQTMPEIHDITAYRDYLSRVDRFADALERLITLAEFYVSTGDESDFWLYHELPDTLNPMLRRALIEADKARWLTGKPPWQLLWDLPLATPPPVQYAAIPTGLKMYSRALEQPWWRWRLDSEPKRYFARRSSRFQWFGLFCKRRTAG